MAKRRLTIEDRLLEAVKHSDVRSFLALRRQMADEMEDMTDADFVRTARNVRQVMLVFQAKVQLALASVEEPAADLHRLAADVQALLEELDVFIAEYDQLRRSTVQ